MVQYTNFGDIWNDGRPAVSAIRDYYANNGGVTELDFTRDYPGNEAFAAAVTLHGVALRKINLT